MHPDDAPATLALRSALAAWAALLVPLFGLLLTAWLEASPAVLLWLVLLPVALLTSGVLWLTTAVDLVRHAVRPRDGSPRRAWTALVLLLFAAPALALLGLLLWGFLEGTLGYGT